MNPWFVLPTVDLFMVVTADSIFAWTNGFLFMQMETIQYGTKNKPLEADPDNPESLNTTNAFYCGLQKLATSKPFFCYHHYRPVLFRFHAIQ